MKSLFDQDRALSVVQPRQFAGALLSTSAQLLHEWIGADVSVADVLRRQNDLDVCLVLTGDGPRYLLKKDIRGLSRFSTKLYYDSKFADLLLGWALRHHGHTQFVCRGLAKHICFTRMPVCVALA